MSEAVKAFLLYSMPDSTEWNCREIHEDSKATDLSIRPFSGAAHGFRFGPQIDQPFSLELNLSRASNASQHSVQSYMELVQKGIEFSRFHKGKVVLSRTRDVETDTSLWGKWLMRLRMRLPATFTYLLHHPTLGTWMGATPETLVKRDQQQFETHSLAGTKWGTESFSKKEFVEQEVVTREILSALELNANHAGTRSEVSFGAIRHLSTPIRWTSSDEIQIVAEKLHPTPAVCGHPKKQAKAFILENEQYDRGLYTGYLLLRNGDQQQTAFVNLRCMRLFEGCVRIFAGGGVNAMSDPRTEWLETEVKMGSIIESLSAKEDI